MSDWRDELERYFATTTTGADAATVAGQVAWRLACFDQGRHLAGYVEERYLPLDGRLALDCASGWGGHAAALAERGAHVVAADLDDHAHASLGRWARDRSVPIGPVRASCEVMPYPDACFDVVLALELIEHIPSPRRFATELARVMRPGAVCVLSTPPRLRSVVYGEPHWGLRGLALLPFALQGPVARRFFRRDYPFPIERQYALASSVARPFVRVGLEATPILEGRLGERLGPGAGRAAAELLWSYVILNKPA